MFLNLIFCYTFIKFTPNKFNLLLSVVNISVLLYEYLFYFIFEANSHNLLCEK